MLDVPKISAVIITLNEERLLGETLRRLSFCDEIVVVDSGSQDRTVEIANQAGARVIHQPFLGYGKQKKFSVNQAQYDWVLNLDADEWLQDDAEENIRQAIHLAEQSGPERLIAAYRLCFRLYFLGHEFKYGHESSRLHKRLFRKSFANFDDATVHEHLQVSTGRIVNLPITVEHHSYPDMTWYIKKLNEYTTNGAQRAKVKRLPLLRILLAPFMFIKFYFLQKNFLNGLPGLYWSLLSSISYLVKYLKVYEHQRIARK